MITSRLVKTLLLAVAFAAVTASCTDDEAAAVGRPVGDGTISVGLQYAGFGNDPRAARMTPADYDRVEFVVADAAGRVVSNMKGYYDKASSAIHIEGLQPGRYSLHVIGAKGDWAADGVVFEDIGHTAETWLRFPEDRSAPLAAEYFRSSTAFTVRAVQGDGGQTVTADLPGSIEQKRIVARLDVGLTFNNPYIEYAVTEALAVLDGPVFYTEVSADGQFYGESQAGKLTLDVAGGRSYLLLPTAGGYNLEGYVSMKTRGYTGNDVMRLYQITTAPMTANHINTVNVEALHPEDGNGTMFITDKAYAKGNHKMILQDDEPHTVYTDQAQRSFNTAEPMQVRITAEGSLSVRFYSPKPVSGVLIRARLAATGGEYIDLAYFDTVPAFADFSAALPALSREAVYRTESGRILTLPRLGAGELQEADFKIVSADPYWAKLRKIEHGWDIRFALYGGDPTKPDGGPAGNWMGIRPVHCREVVAFFLNFTYMIDMPEHEEILRANEDRLYGNGGVDDKVTAETVLAQMRQKRSIRVGLVYTGNLVMGLGGGDVFGAYQGGWFEHYTSAYACEVMFHELGHVMGYSHDSSFTYGPWAQELMNNFYINNISKMPVESPKYLNSASNPNRYH